MSLVFLSWVVVLVLELQMSAAKRRQAEAEKQPPAVSEEAPLEEEEVVSADGPDEGLGSWEGTEGVQDGVAPRQPQDETASQEDLTVEDTVPGSSGFSPQEGLEDRGSAAAESTAAPGGPRDADSGRLAGQEGTAVALGISGAVLADGWEVPGEGSGMWEEEGEWKEAQHRPRAAQHQHAGMAQRGGLTASSNSSLGLSRRQWHRFPAQRRPHNPGPAPMHRRPFPPSQPRGPSPFHAQAISSLAHTDAASTSAAPIRQPPGPTPTRDADQPAAAAPAAAGVPAAAGNAAGPLTSVALVAPPAQDATAGGEAGPSQAPGAMRSWKDIALANQGRLTSVTSGARDVEGGTSLPTRGPSVAPSGEQLSSADVGGLGGGYHGEAGVASGEGAALPATPAPLGDGDRSVAIPEAEDIKKVLPGSQILSSPQEALHPVAGQAMNSAPFQETGPDSARSTPAAGLPPHPSSVTEAPTNPDLTGTADSAAPLPVPTGGASVVPGPASAPSKLSPLAASFEPLAAAPAAGMPGMFPAGAQGASPPGAGPPFFPWFAPGIPSPQAVLVPTGAPAGSQGSALATSKPMIASTVPLSGPHFLPISPSRVLSVMGAPGAHPGPIPWPPQAVYPPLVPPMMVYQPSPVHQGYASGMPAQLAPEQAQSIAQAAPSVLPFPVPFSRGPVSLAPVPSAEAAGAGSLGPNSVDPSEPQPQESGASPLNLCPEEFPPLVPSAKDLGPPPAEDTGALDLQAVMNPLASEFVPGQSWETQVFFSLPPGEGGPLMLMPPFGGPPQLLGPEALAAWQALGTAPPPGGGVPGEPLAAYPEEQLKECIVSETYVKPPRRLREDLAASRGAPGAAPWERKRRAGPFRKDVREGTRTTEAPAAGAHPPGVQAPAGPRGGAAGAPAGGVRSLSTWKRRSKGGQHGYAPRSKLEEASPGGAGAGQSSSAPSSPERRPPLEDGPGAAGQWHTSKEEGDIRPGPAPLSDAGQGSVPGALGGSASQGGLQAQESSAGAGGSCLESLNADSLAAPHADVAPGVDMEAGDQATVAALQQVEVA